jgi:hypothetical protein
MSAIFLHSDSPPAAHVSGWTMSTACETSSSRKPNRVNSHSPPRDRDRKRGFHGSISHQVFGRHRFLEPSDIMPLDLPAEPDRVHGVVSMVRINHQRNIGSDG